MPVLETRATRHVTRRDGRLEGEVDPEEDGAPDALFEKECQRDLTSLSGHVPVTDRSTVRNRSNA